MKQTRTVGVFLLACGALCFVIAVDKYLTAVRTAKAIADLYDEFEFESTGVPIETTVCGLVGMTLLVAGLRLVYISLMQSKSEPEMLD